MNHQIKLFGKALPKSPSGTSYLWFDSLCGHEKISELFEYQLIVKVRDEFNNPVHGYQGLEGFTSKKKADNGGPPASDLNLQSLIGTEITVCVRLDGFKLNSSQLAPINNLDNENTYQNSFNGARFFRGIVSRVEVLPVRNRHATYKVTLVPWLWLLTKTTNYKIFQKKNVLQIIEEVLERYPFHVEYRCSGSYSTLDFQVQYGEDDFSFIQRLMQEFSLNFHFEHSRNHLTLIISDHNAAYKEMDAEGYRNLIIYPPNQRFPHRAEYIEFFEPAQQLVSGKVQLSDYQFKKVNLVQTAKDDFQWNHDFAEQEIYEWQQGDFISAENGGKLKAKQHVEQLYQHGYRAKGKGHLKGLQTGFRFNLENHPNSDSNRGWLILGTQTTIQDISEEKADHHFYDSVVEFIAQPDEFILRPDRTLDKPSGRPQTAIVVGPPDEEIHTDQFGRVKVKFHWDRLHPSSQSSDEDGIFGENDGTNTCWLRVGTAWAGNNYGTIHLPRIGQEVIVDFFNGDPDMPFVSGRLANPDNMPLWDLPDQKALSGIKSRELGGSQANQLVMDDTSGQVQVHLKSDHQSSELNLGYITRIPDQSGRKDYRGEGFELRTDGHGVIRSGQGLILSTYAKANAESYAKSINETIQQLTNATDIHKLQTQTAISHKADERTIDKTAQAELAKQLQSIKGQEQKKFSELSDPQIVVAASSGVAIVSEKTIHFSSKEHIALTTKKDISLVSENNLFASVAKGITLFAQNLGARIFTAKGKIEIEAQSDDIEIIADQNIKLLSLKKKIEIVAAEEILFNVNGNYIKIDKNGIEQGTQNNWVVHANRHKFESEKTLSYVLPAFKGTNDEAFRILDDKGNALTGFRYKIVIGDNEQVFRGETDEKGFTSRINSGFDSKKVTIYQDVDEQIESASESGTEDNNEKGEE